MQVSQALGTTADAVTDYSYDALGRVTSVQQHGVSGGNAVAEKRVDFTYDAVSQYATITTYADLAATQEVSTATYAYNAIHELIGLVYTQGATTLASYSYTYDSAFNLRSMTSLDGTNSYTYDATGQLVSTDSDYTTDESYAYDDTGNRVTANGDSYVTGDDNQLLSDGTYTYAYDAEGNRMARFVDTNTNGVLDSGDTDITTYTWDYRNRLTAVSTFDDYADYSAGTSSSVVSYVYDYANRLIGRTLDADGTVGTGDIHETVYSYDGNQIVLQFDKTYANGSATDLTATDLSHRYVWDSQAVDHLFADEDVSETELLYTLTDHQGSVRDLASYDSQTGVTTIANHRVYDAYGNLQSETNSAVDCLFGYTGRPYDEATGLQNNLHRWYDARSGRWLSRDPIGFAARDANVHRYCGNRPTNTMDPSGLTPPKDGVSVAFYDASDTGQTDSKGELWAADADQLRDYAIQYVGPHNAHPIVDYPGTRAPVAQAIDTLMDYANRGVNVKYLHIEDHGRAGYQEFGKGKGLTEEDFERLGRMIDPKGMIIMQGCNTGLDRNALEQFARAAKRRVRGRTNLAGGEEDRSNRFVEGCSYKLMYTGR